MSSKGFILLHRAIQDHWIYDEKRTFSKYEAWLDLLMMVNHSDNKVMQDGEFVTVKRGERITSIRELMNRWGWSNTKVNNFLKLCQEDNMIECIIHPKKKTVIKIVNYEKWQGFRHSEQSEETTEKRQKKDTKKTQKRINNNDNNENNENKTNIVREVIEYLNEKAGTKFKHTAADNKKRINARVNEGYTLEDFKSVIDHKVSTWKGVTFSNGQQGDIYLRPKTLFSGSFDGYLNEAKTSNSTSPPKNKWAELEEEFK